jgi:type VI secretion system protein ImpK
VLRLQHPGFASWGQRPLQEELFGHARAGEIFFDYLRALLAKEDSAEVADSLEVYALCLLLGFKGKYALGAGDSATRPSGELDSLVRQIRGKIERIRGQATFLRAEAPPLAAPQAVAVDRWSRGLGIAALCLFILVILAYGAFWITLSSGASRTV